MRHPLGFGQPSDISQLVVYLFSDAGRWITGSSIVVDGGYSVI
jgi:NAD(P)-dependent dehydrogenase (short-subunit alcohol dehydrogenase family)